MKRLASLGLVVAAAACNVGEPPSLTRLVLSPVLDSIFVGDSASARIALYYDDRGTLVGPVVPTWASSAPSVVGVDATTGKIAGLARGFAVLTAIYNQAQGQALVVASRPLELSLLLDTVYLMAGDQVTVPVEVKKKGGGAPPAWFSAPANAVFSIDSATGLVTGASAGGPLRFYAHADVLVDSGAVEVVDLADTVGGKSYYTVLGTYLRRTSSGTRLGDPARHHRRRFHVPRAGVRPLRGLRSDLPPALELGVVVHARGGGARLGPVAPGGDAGDQPGEDDPQRPGGERLVLVRGATGGRLRRPDLGPAGPRHVRRTAHHRPLALRVVTFEHTFADLGGIAADRLSDTQGLAAVLLAAANAAGLHPAGTPQVHGGPTGVAAVLVCHGGHVALHALPDAGLCYADVAGVGAVRPQRGLDVIVKRLAAREVRTDARRRAPPSTPQPERP